ncbi:hypothetical protein [Ruegeria sp. MALMAid1280]|uniref:hypothetical protein n=1 Tax=Ruegeria sp. MALMAid1280 TaxID=3411634 RepID=UPI003B9E8A5D
MKFLNTVKLNEIKDLIGFGLLDAVTTNPGPIAISGRDFKKVVAEVCTLTNTQFRRKLRHWIPRD